MDGVFPSEVDTGVPQVASSVDSLESPMPITMELTVEELRDLVKCLSKELGELLQPKELKLNLPVFHWKGPINFFIDQCKIYARVQRLPDKKKLDFFFPQFSGKAVDWYAIATH